LDEGNFYLQSASYLRYGISVLKEMLSASETFTFTGVNNNVATCKSRELK